MELKEHAIINFRFYFQLMLISVLINSALYFTKSYLQFKMILLTKAGRGTGMKVGSIHNHHCIGGNGYCKVEMSGPLAP